MNFHSPLIVPIICWKEPKLLAVVNYDTQLKSFFSFKPVLFLCDLSISVENILFGDDFCKNLRHLQTTKQWLFQTRPPCQVGRPRSTSAWDGTTTLSTWSQCSPGSTRWVESCNHQDVLLCSTGWIIGGRLPRGWGETSSGTQGSKITEEAQNWRKNWQSFTVDRHTHSPLQSVNLDIIIYACFV